MPPSRRSWRAVWSTAPCKRDLDVLDQHSLQHGNKRQLRLRAVAAPPAPQLFEISRRPPVTTSHHSRAVVPLGQSPSPASTRTSAACLLLVVNGHDVLRLTFCIRERRRARPRLSVVGHDSVPRPNDLPVLLYGDCRRARVHTLERDGVERWLACDLVVHAVVMGGECFIGACPVSPHESARAFDPVSFQGSMTRVRLVGGGPVNVDFATLSLQVPMRGLL